ncbi:MAG: hypothetical protein HC831_11280 [Chloroflexia bacterium]|nr:hypothetical protein [Chloroflexia bacterium]
MVKLDFQNRNLEKIVEKRNAEVIEKNKQLEKLVEAKEILLQVQAENAQLKQEELKRDLEIKEKELTTHTMLMVQKQNLLDGFVDKLNLIKKNLGKENVTDINGLEKQLKIW